MSGFGNNYNVQRTYDGSATQYRSAPLPQNTTVPPNVVQTHAAPSGAYIKPVVYDVPVVASSKQPSSHGFSDNWNGTATAPVPAAPKGTLHAVSSSPAVHMSYSEPQAQQWGGASRPSGSGQLPASQHALHSHTHTHAPTPHPHPHPPYPQPQPQPPAPMASHLSFASSLVVPGRSGSPANAYVSPTPPGATDGQSPLAFSAGHVSTASRSSSGPVGPGSGIRHASLPVALPPSSSSASSPTHTPALTPYSTPPVLGVSTGQYGSSSSMSSLHGGQGGMNPHLVAGPPPAGIPPAGMSASYYNPALAHSMTRATPPLSSSPASFQPPSLSYMHTQTPAPTPLTQSYSAADMNKKAQEERWRQEAERKRVEDAAHAHQQRSAQEDAMRKQLEDKRKQEEEWRRQNEERLREQELKRKADDELWRRQAEDRFREQELKRKADQDAAAAAAAAAASAAAAEKRRVEEIWKREADERRRAEEERKRAEDARRRIELDEQRRIATIEAERKRLEFEEAQRIRAQAEEARKREEERQRKEFEDLKRKREVEEEIKRQRQLEAKRQEEEQFRRHMEEMARQEREAKERALREWENQMRLEQERLKREAAERFRIEEERRRAIEAEQRRIQEEQRRLWEEEQRRLAAIAEAQRLAAEALRRQEEERRKKEEEEREAQRRAAEERKRKEEEEFRRQMQELKAREDAELRRRMEEMQQKQMEERRRQELLAEQQEKIRREIAEREEMWRREAELRFQQEAEAQRRRQEEEARKQRELEERLRRQEEERQRQEAERQRQAEEQRRCIEEENRKKREQEEIQRRLEEERWRKEAEARFREEEEKKRMEMLESERRRAALEEQRRREEEEFRKQVEAMVAREAAERQRREALERQRKEEEEKLRQEEERKQKEFEEQRRVVEAQRAQQLAEQRRREEEEFRKQMEELRRADEEERKRKELEEKLRADFEREEARKLKALEEKIRKEYEEQRRIELQQQKLREMEEQKKREEEELRVKRQKEELQRQFEEKMKRFEANWRKETNMKISQEMADRNRELERLAKQEQELRKKIEEESAVLRSAAPGAAPAESVQVLQQRQKQLEEQRRKEEEDFRKEMENKWKQEHDLQRGQRERELKRSFIMSSGGAGVVCPICDEQFITESALSQHIDDWHTAKSTAAFRKSMAPSSQDDSGSTTRDSSRRAPVGPGKLEPPKTDERRGSGSGLARTSVDPARTTMGKNDSASLRATHAVPQKRLPAPPVPRRKQGPIDSTAQIILAQAQVRGFLQRKRYKQESFRVRVVKELAQSERVYVELLGKVVDVIIKPLRRAFESGKPIISDTEMRDLFVNIEDIYTFHHTLLMKLEARVSKWSIERPLADVFIESVSGMTPLYVVYANGFERSNNVLMQCSKHSAWKAFIKIYERDLGQKDLGSHLILPIQRPPRYVLLFKELLRFTSPAHPDRSAQQRMLTLYETVCTEMNEQKRSRDQVAEVKRVYELLEGSKPKLTDDPTRALLREGTFSFFEEENGQLKKRHYYTLSDMLLVAEMKKSPTSKHRLRFGIWYDNARLEPKADGSYFLGQECTHAFILHSPTKSHLFLCETADEKNQLCALIEKAKHNRPKN